MAIITPYGTSLGRRRGGGGAVADTTFALFHFDNTATDERGNLSFTTAPASYSAATKKFGTHSAVFDTLFQSAAGGLDSLFTASYSPNFTIEYFFNSNDGFYSGPTININQKANNNITRMTIRTDYDQATAILVDENGTTIYNSTGAVAISAATWYHVAVSVTPTTLEMHVGGNRILNLSHAAIVMDSCDLLKIFDSEAQGGFIDELRISNSAIYTGATIDVPTGAFS